MLQRVAEIAARNDIILGLEVVNRYETNILNTASQGVEMCKRIGAPNVRVHLDVYHMNIEELDIQQAIIETGDLPRLLPYRGFRIAATWARARSILPACSGRW